MTIQHQLEQHFDEDERRFDRLDERFDTMEEKFDVLGDALDERLHKIESSLSHQKGFIGGVVWVITALFAAIALAIQYFRS